MGGTPGLTGRRSRGAGRLATVLAAGVFALSLAVLGYRVQHDAEIHARPKDEPSWVLIDFQEQLYYPLRAFLDGHNPYGGYPVPNSLAGYAPHTLLLHLPLGLLGYSAAATAYQAVMLVLTLVFAHLVVRFSGAPGGLAATLAVAAGLLLSRPGQMNFINGNETLQVLLGTYVALHFARQRPLLAAAGLAVALIKPTLGVPLAVLMLVRGDVRAVLGGGALAAALSAVMLAVIVPEAGGIGPFVASVRAGITSFDATPETDPISAWSRVDAIALVTKLVGHDLAHATELVLGLLMLAAGALAIRRFLARGGRADSHLVTTLVCLTILVFTYQQAYNVLILSLPVAALIVDPEASPAPRHPALRWMLVGLLLVPFLNFLSTYSALTRLGLEGWQRTLITSLSGLALCTAWITTLGGTLLSGKRRAHVLAPLQRA